MGGIFSTISPCNLLWYSCTLYYVVNLDAATWAQRLYLNEIQLRERPPCGLAIAYSCTPIHELECLEVSLIATAAAQVCTHGEISGEQSGIS